MKFRDLSICLVSMLSVGCSSSQLIPGPGLDDFEIIYPEISAEPGRVTGSIMDNGSLLYPAGRAYAAGTVRIGDIVTILLNEAAQATRENGLATERVSVNELTPGIFGDQTLFDEYANLGELGSTISSNGAGTAGQSATLTGSISAVVTEVMSNGNLVVFGEKQLELNEGSEYIRVRGVIRPEDIQPNNTILSLSLIHI